MGSSDDSKSIFQTRKLHIYRCGWEIRNRYTLFSVCGPVALSSNTITGIPGSYKFHKFEDLVVGDSDASVADTMTYRPGRIKPWIPI